MLADIDRYITDFLKCGLRVDNLLIYNRLSCNIIRLLAKFLKISDRCLLTLTVLLPESCQ